MKRFPCFLLALLMLFSAAFELLPLAGAETLGGNCGSPIPEAMAWTLDTETGILTITGNGSMAAYTKGGAPWTEYHALISELQFSEQVASIGNNAFTLPEPFATPTDPDLDPDATPADAPTPATPSDPSITPGVTSGYPRLLSVTLPESVKKLGNNAFADCTVLSRLTIKNPTCEIGIGIGDPARLTIHGYTGSTAQTYAQTYGYTFVPLDVNGHVHNWREIVRELPGCETYGVIVNFCDGCGEDESIPIEPLGHDVVDDAAVAPTCLEPGLTEGSHCSRCAEVLTPQQTLPALGHDWDEGTITQEPTVAAEGEKLFTCARCQLTRTEVLSRLWFEDVPKQSYYAPAVEWAVVNGITTGVTPTTFAPKDTCTRGHVVTFLWRVAGKPSPVSGYNPFTDVAIGRFYFDAVLWAVENGITTGVTPTTFEPDGECTRGHVVTFLWRASGQPKPAVTTHPFTDVKPSAFYYRPMLWALGANITTGTSPTTFSPTDPCTRGDVVTFLWRAAGRPDVPNSILNS